jgi:hypothetical protein
MSQTRKPDENFFGKNISIQAIVGKNGSGKSSILEILYRMINNFAFHMVKKQNRRAAELIYHVEGLYADLYFVKGNILGTLICRGEFIGFTFDDYKICFGIENSLFPDFTFYENIKNEEVLNIAKLFFYTIVTNYSLQSFIDFDYKTERSNRFQANGKTGIDSSAIWINSLFHKNDGYLTPIVLNPYRSNGIIDLRKEYQLTNSRISSILIESLQSKRQFIDGYQLHSIEYKYDPLIVFQKFEESKKKNAYYDDFTLNFINADKKSFSSIILREYGCVITDSLSQEYTTACIYLVYKTLSIASKYPSFNRFEQFDNINDYSKKTNQKEQTDLIELVSEIIKHKSHITVKIRQTLKFIEWFKNQKAYPQHDSYDFTYNEYISGLNLKKQLRGLDDIIEHMPPPFFSFDIKLYKINQYKNKPNEPILFQRMSSGERQFIYTMSTFIYHIKNLLSIQQTNRVRYRSINLILDEVELCFHPEYQRLFVDSLIRTIQRLKLNTHCSFNIIIATHSPFVLSDIPMSNILHLKDGTIQSKDQFKNPFCANINDILFQSFFLENGFIGQFAVKKVSSLIEFLSGKAKSDWNKDKAEECVELIGDPIIKSEMQTLFYEKFKKDAGEKDPKDLKIERLEKEIERLRNL